MTDIKKIEGCSSSAKEYLSDESNLIGYADCLYFPRSEEDIISIVKDSYDNGIPFTISGGRTGIVGGAVPNSGNLICLSGLDNIMDVKKINSKDNQLNNLYEEILVLTAQPGVLLKDLQEKALSEGFFYPINATEDTAHIGGTVATNASGSRSFKYGSTRRYINRIRVVLPSGSPVEVLRGQYFPETDGYFSANNMKISAPSFKMPHIKNAAGYYSKKGMDLIDLFIGSEGTLGLITEVDVVALPRPEIILTALAFFPSENDAIGFVKDSKLGKVKPMSLEYFDYNSLKLLRDSSKHAYNIPPLPAGSKSAVLFEQECKEEELEDVYDMYSELLEKHNSSMEDTWGGIDEDERIARVRHALPEAINSIIRSKPEGIHKVSTDMAVPSESFDYMMNLYKHVLTQEGLDYIIFGHIGDNHLHVNVLPDSLKELERAKILYHKFAREAVARGGTVSAEHGIGKLKKELLEIMYGTKAIKEMVAIKRALDPKMLLNRGNLFDELG